MNAPLDTAPNPWVLPLPARPGARMRLYCFPFAGGGISLFARWSAGLPDDVEIVGVQLPGRENRIDDPPITRFPDLVATLCQAFTQSQSALPFAFFGHCAGALLAYECAQALREVDAPLPLALIASAAPAPVRWDGRRMAYDLGGADPIEAYRRLGGMPPGLAEDPELAELVRTVLRADTALYGGYAPRPRPPLPLPIVALAADHDTLVPPPQTQQWQWHSTLALRSHHYPGGHFSVLEHPPPLLPHLATVLSTALATLP